MVCVGRTVWVVVLGVILLGFSGCGHKAVKLSKREQQARAAKCISLHPPLSYMNKREARDYTDAYRSMCRALAKQGKLAKSGAPK